MSVWSTGKGLILDHQEVLEKHLKQIITLSQDYNDWQWTNCFSLSPSLSTGSTAAIVFVFILTVILVLGGVYYYKFRWVQSLMRSPTNYINMHLLMHWRSSDDTLREM